MVQMKHSKAETLTLQRDGIAGAPRLDFDAWRALLRSNCGRDVEVTAPNAFAGWMRPFNAYGLEATSVKIKWGSAEERSYRDVCCDGADHYLILFQVAGQTAMTQMDQAAQLAVGDVALVDAARPVTYLSRFRSPRGADRRVEAPEQSVVSGTSNQPGPKAVSEEVELNVRIRAFALPVLAVKDRKSTRLNSSHRSLSRMPSSA